MNSGLKEPLGRSFTGFFKGSKSTKDLKELVKEYPTDVQDYDLLEDCGRGVSATVYRALCKPFHEIVAVKKMNLECMNCDLDEVIHEAQLMKNYNHTNVLPLYTSFVTGQDLWMVMPFISGGSVLHIIKYAYPEGLEEVVVATIMKEVLRALDYVHRQGGIHRDIKAGNILVDKDGCVYLADFGVATSLDRTGSWGHDKGNRMTFVGTPCWMAPEVMEQTAGYDNAADIWSFGISLLEMAHGHAPFAKFPPMKVLLMTLQNPPPTLDDRGKKQFSKAMRDVVSKCLQKDPRLRPPASQLLEHKFFKQAKDADFLSKHLMAGLAPLGDRVQEIRQGKAATTPHENDRNFARSQEEYKKGVSSWNFDVAALKAQADLEGDDEPLLPSILEIEENVDLTGARSPVPEHRVKSPVLEHGVGAEDPVSAFATPKGQAAALSTGVILPSIDLALTTQDNAYGTGSGPPSGNRSPRPMSREDSNGMLQNALSPTLSAIAQKKGRFSVYEGGEEPPPLSPPHGLQSGPLTRDLEASLSLTSQRLSEDGVKREPVSLSDPLEEAVSAEPKKKGRFTVIENGGSSSLRSPSTANLGDPMKRNMSDNGLSGKPPAGPSGMPTVSVVLPRLQELLDQASQHHASLQKLLVAVQETERTGKASALLNRSLKGLADSSGPPAAAESESPEELRAALEQLRTRLGEMEAENSRLKARNRELEDASLASEGGSGPSMTSLNHSPHGSRLNLGPHPSHDDAGGASHGYGPF